MATLGSKIPVRVKTGSKNNSKSLEKRTDSACEAFKITTKKDDVFKIHEKKTPFKSSNHPSQPFKITTKKDVFKIHERNTPFKSSNHPSQPVKITTKEDDVSKIHVKMSPFKSSNHPSQKDIEFVADDRMRNLILSNTELTPSILKSCSKSKTPMVMERPSLYNRPRIDVDPYEQAFKDIANYNLKEGRRISEIKNNGLCTSNSQGYNSLYRRCSFLSGDPYQEALKSIKELRMHRKDKKCKKVRFNLSSEGQSQKTACKLENDGKKSVKLNQPQSPDLNSKCSESHILLTSISNPSKVNEIFVNSEKLENNECFDENTEPSTLSPLKMVASNKKTVNEFSPVLHENQKCHRNADIISREIHKTVDPFLNPIRTTEVRSSLFSKQSEHDLDQMKMKIFTPQPVSFYPRTKMSESFSPELFNRRTSDILSFAPINTPSVLRSLSRQDCSPICKKLEFLDSPTETDNPEKKNQTFDLQNIMTKQKMLDQLAHQECSIFMHEATFPCEIRRNLRNPISKILDNGDEMHFVPVIEWS